MTSNPVQFADASTSNPVQSQGPTTPPAVPAPAHKYAKFIPYTWFVLCAMYYTPFFTTEYWKNQPPQTTFRDVVLQTLPDSTDSQTRAGICYVADAVDNLEDMLSRSPPHRASMGLGPDPPARDVRKIRSQIVRPFWVTLLLDRLLWAFTWDGTSMKVRMNSGKYCEAGKSASAPMEKGSNSMLDMDGPAIQSCIQKFLESARVASGPRPKWDDIPTITSADEPDNAKIEEEQKHKMFASISVLGAHTRTNSFADIILATANVLNLACSALFLTANNTDTDYFSKFDQALSKSFKDRIQINAIREAAGISSQSSFPSKSKSKGNGKGKGKGKENAEDVLPHLVKPIMIALSGTPIFVLDPARKLGEMKLRTNFLNYGHILKQCFKPPTIQGTCQLASEAAIWRAVAPWIGCGLQTDQELVPASVSQPFLALMGPPINTLGHMVSQITKANDDAAQPLEIEHVPWEDGHELQYVANQIAAETQRVQAAEIRAAQTRREDEAKAAEAKKLAEAAAASEAKAEMEKKNHKEQEELLSRYYHLMVDNLARFDHPPGNEEIAHYNSHFSSGVSFPERVQEHCMRLAHSWEAAIVRDPSLPNLFLTTQVANPSARNWYIMSFISSLHELLRIHARGAASNIPSKPGAEAQEVDDQLAGQKRPRSPTFQSDSEEPPSKRVKGNSLHEDDVPIKDGTPEEHYASSCNLAWFIPPSPHLSSQPSPGPSPAPQDDQEQVGQAGSSHAQIDEAPVAPPVPTPAPISDARSKLRDRQFPKQTPKPLSGEKTKVSKQKQRGKGKSKPAQKSQDVKPKLSISRHTTYEVVDNEIIESWIEVAETMQDHRLLTPKPTNNSAGIEEDVIPAQCWFTQEGSLRSREATYKVNWPAGTQEDRGLFHSALKNDVGTKPYNGPLPSADNQWLQEHWSLGSDLPEGDVFTREFMDSIMDEDAPLEWIATVQRLLADRTVHIPNPKRSCPPQRDNTERLLSVSELEARWKVQTGVARQVHKLECRDENDHEAHMCKATIRSVLEPRRLAMNFLDMPAPSANTCPAPSFLTAVALDGLAAQMPIQDGFPQYSTKWQLLATLAALSRAHIDAGKFATWIEVLRGAKIWAVLQGDPPDEPLVDINYSDYSWKFFLLEQGDILIMPPGTIHIALTVCDSLLTGGHFYSAFSMESSLRAGLIEHARGSLDTNTQHVASECILHTLVHSYALEMQHAQQKDNPLEQHHVVKSSHEMYQDVLRRWPPLPQLAALLVMCAHPRYFEPEVVNEQQKFTCKRSLLTLRKISRKRALDMIKFCPDLVEPVDRLQRLVKSWAIPEDPPMTSLLKGTRKPRQSHSTDDKRDTPEEEDRDTSDVDFDAEGERDDADEQDEDQDAGDYFGGEADMELGTDES